MNVGEFQYKNINSNAFRLTCKSISRPLTPQMRTRSTVIYGKDGLIDYGSNNYDPRPIVMHIAYIGDNYLELRNRSREIGAWLSSKEWTKLIFNDEPDKYYLARVYESIVPENLYRLGEADITFICQPFAYMVVSTAEDSTWDEADFPWVIDLPWNMSSSYIFTANMLTSFEFNNPGNKETSQNSPQGSQFNLIISGSFTTLSLTMNGKTLNYTQSVSNGVVVINNIDMEVTLNGVNSLDAIDGDIDSFLTIESGINTLEVDGTNLAVEVKIDFIPEWI